MNRSVLRRSVAPATLAIAVSLGLAACGGGDASTSPTGPELGGTIKVDGSSTVYPLTEAAAELFREEQPKVNVTVGQSGTGGGFEKFCAGETDISDASRPMKDDEKKACDGRSTTFSEFQVANDALTVVVNKDNTWVDCLTSTSSRRSGRPARR